LLVEKIKTLFNLDYTITSDFSQINRNDWSDFVNEHPNGNFFQTPQHIDFLLKITGFSPVTLFAKKKGALAGVLCGAILSDRNIIKSFFSSRLIIWGGPLVEENNTFVADLLLKNLIQIFSSKVIYIEFRNLFDTTVFQNTFSKYGFSFMPHLNFVVQTDSEPLVKSRISKSKLRQIDLSLKNGAYISEPGSESEVRQFYLLLKNHYKKKIQKPLPDLNFFIEFFNQKEVGKIFLVKLNADILGGIVCPIFNQRIIYEWYICSKKDMKGIHPGVVATWAPISFALKNGFKEFNFMGAGSPEQSYGVREFKAKFGGDLISHGRIIYTSKPMLYNIGKIGLSVYNFISRILF
jgi:serine/alanine adding enzyme